MFNLRFALRGLADVALFLAAAVALTLGALGVH
jgi:hypothetical protein